MCKCNNSDGLSCSQKNIPFSASVPKSRVGGCLYIQQEKGSLRRVSLVMLSRLAQHLYAGGSRATFGLGN